MFVPNLVPIGPQATTCIPSEGYTHRHTHTLVYRYRLSLAYYKMFFTLIYLIFIKFYYFYLFILGQYSQLTILRQMLSFYIIRKCNSLRFI